MTALRTYQERVRKSALQLDETHPKWERHVSIETLDMNQHDVCVSGQLGLADGMNQALGFCPSERWSSEEWMIAIGQLKRLWIHQIRLRRKADYISRKARKVKVA